jgi:hypothetical protein
LIEEARRKRNMGIQRPPDESSAHLECESEGDANNYCSATASL